MVTLNVTLKIDNEKKRNREKERKKHHKILTQELNGNEQNVSIKSIDLFHLVYM